MDKTLPVADYLWFLDTLVHIRVPSAAGRDRLSVIESDAPTGHGPPLHIHHTEDEIFHVLAGELRLHVAEAESRLVAGDSVLAPKGVPHAFRVVSAAGARWLNVTGHGDFEGFVRAMARPAERPERPPAAPPDAAAQARLKDTAAAFGIAIVGPPLDDRAPVRTVA